MSLIAWWPLNGHTNNYGTMSGELQATASGVAYSDGKIGKAMYTGSLNLTADQWKKIIGNTISIAMWVYTRDDGNYSAGTPFFGNGGMTKPNNRKFTMFHYSTKTTLHCSWQHDDQSGTDAKSTYWGCSYTNFFEINKWVHLCVVQDAATETITVYRNGEEYSRTKVDGLASFNIKSAAAAPVRNSIDYQHTNDIRIYDHALSAFEVKEIAKALVVHYTFDDRELAPVNLITSFGTLSRCTKYGNGVKIDWSSNSGDTYFMMNLLDPLVKGETYTISFDCEGTIGDAVEFRICNLKNYPIVLKSGKNSLTFVAGDDLLADSRFFLDDATRDSSVFTITNIQLERNDHATPYVEWNKTPAQVGTVGNDAGYAKGKATDLMFGPGKIGERSGRFNGTTSYVDIPIVKSDMFTSDYTLSFWTYPLDNGRAIYLGDYNNATGLNFERNSGDEGTFRYYHGGNPNWYYSAANAPVGEWTHLAITYSAPTSSSTTGTLLIYKNGVCVNNDAGNTQKSHTSTMTKTVGNTTRLGADYRTSSTTDGTPLWGYVDDFRYYATCLSEKDIEDLYRTKAYITDKSDIVCGEFIENKIDTMITEKSTFECKEIYEEIDPAYERLDYTDAPYNSSSVNTCPHIDTGIPAGTKIRRLETLHYLNSSKASQIMFGNNGLYCFYREWNDPRPNYGVIAGGSDYIQTSVVMQPALVYATCDIRANKTIELYVHQELPDGTVNEQTVTGTHNDTFATDAGNYYLFGYNLNGSRGYPTPCKMYMFRVYGENGLLRDFVPAKRKSDGTIGMYDSVTNGFFANVGNGSFEAGDVKTSTDVIFQSSHDIGVREIIEI